MKAQTMLIIPFSLTGIVYRTSPDKIVSCAGVNSMISCHRGSGAFQNKHKLFHVLASLQSLR